jgi:hypothetical protein
MTTTLPTTTIRPDEYNELEDNILSLNYKAGLENIRKSYGYLTFEDMIYIELMRDIVLKALSSER